MTGHLVRHKFSLMMTGRELMPLLRGEIEQDLLVWLRDVAKRKGLTQADVARQFPFQIHPNAVEKWFQGRDRPSYATFVGLCLAVGELPPVLQELCRSDTP